MKKLLLFIILSFIYHGAKADNNIIWRNLGNKSNFSNVALSPSGKLIVFARSGALGSNTEVWDLTKSSMIYQSDVKSPISFSFNKSEDKVCSISDLTTTLNIYDLKANKKTQYTSADYRINYASFIPGSDSIAVFLYDYSKVISYFGIIDSKTATLVKTIKIDKSSTYNTINTYFILSPDGKYFISLLNKIGFDTVSTNNEMRIYSIATGKFIYADTLNSLISTAFFTADGKKIISTGSPKFSDSSFTINTWDAEKCSLLSHYKINKFIPSISKFDSDSNKIRFFGQGGFLLDFYIDGTQRTVQMNQPLYFQQQFSNFAFMDSDTLFFINGIYLSKISLGFDGSLKNEGFWPLSISPSHSDRVTSVNLSKDFKSILTSGMDGKIKSWITESGTLNKQVFSADSFVVSKMKYSHDGKKAAWINQSNKANIIVYDLIKDTVLNRIYLADTIAYAFDWSADDSKIAISSITKISIYPINSSQAEKTYQPTSPVLALKYSNDGKKLALGQFNGELKILNSTTLDSITTFLQVDSITIMTRINDIRFTPDDKYVVASSFNGFAFSFNLSSNTFYQRYNSATDYGNLYFGNASVDAIRIAKDGKYIIGLVKGIIKVWDFDKGSDLYVYDDLWKTNSQVTFTTFDVDDEGSFIVAGSNYGDLIKLKSWWVVGVEDNPKQQSLASVYPNPLISGNQANIKFLSSVSEPIQIDLINIYGERISSLNTITQSDENTIPMEISKLSNGIYFAIIKGNANNYRIQFVISN
ncbi:MAG: T9SS type A sorting domain-containing protein [Candidatus Kapabacteria bacterium]|nr:T9SS type A sorting domain-containing protein [Candidatus Kapabacteria bacterium]